MAKKTLDISKEDIYGLLNVSPDATEKEITKAYRKQALKCHPDKNPDNPAAGEQFHKLTQALEVLLDAAARAAYDKILKARAAALLRQKQFDSKRKKFKDELDARERAANEQKEDAGLAARKLQQEIERLRKEGNQLLEETQAQLRRDLEEQLRQPADSKVINDDGDSDTDETVTAKIKAKWKIKKGENRDEGYTKAEITQIFSTYGEVLNIVLSVKKSGTAIIEFASPYMADIAVKNECGKAEFPLTLSWLSGQPSEDMLRKQQNTHVENPEDKSGVGASGSHPLIQRLDIPPTEDMMKFESVVLRQMRQAEERKRLLEQMQKEDELESEKT